MYKVMCIIFVRVKWTTFHDVTEHVMQNSASHQGTNGQLSSSYAQVPPLSATEAHDDIGIPVKSLPQEVPLYPVSHDLAA
jgi:hypothetical protein